MAISKAKFFEILDYLQENNRFEDDLRQLLYNSKRDTDFIDAAMFTDCYLIDYVIYLLQNAFNDNHTGWISYWIYELDFGRSWKPGLITDVNGKDIRLQTKEDLYRFLMPNFIGTITGDLNERNNKI